MKKVLLTFHPGSGARAAATIELAFPYGKHGITIYSNDETKKRNYYHYLVTMTLSKKKNNNNELTH